MSTSLRIWLTILLLALMSLTGVMLWKITGDPRARPVGSSPRPVVNVERQDRPLDLASYTMTERSGATFNMGKLKGEVWIASMFFTSCPHQCADMNKTIAALQNDPELLKVRFVSISVDPAIDTPAALAEYAKIFDADPGRWLFLRPALSELPGLGADLGVTTGYKKHTRRLVLFDRSGRVRGHFQYDDPQHITQLKSLAASLASE